jgi:hypothetical protein
MIEFMGKHRYFSTFQQLGSPCHILVAFVCLVPTLPDFASQGGKGNPVSKLTII